MWIIFILALCTAAVSNVGWSNSIRFSVGPLHVNFYLMLLIFACLAALIRGRHYRLCFPVERNHPLVGPLLVLFGAGWLAGLFGMIWLDSDMIFNKDAATHVREFLALPAAIFIGYRLTATPRSAERFVYVIVSAGVAVSVAIILYFRSSAAAAQATGSLDMVRTISFLSDYAGIACVLLVYGIAASVSLFKTRTALVLAAFCLLGQMAPLHRSSWIACAAGFAGMILILPREQRLRSALIGVMTVPVFALTLWLAMFVASVWTGWDFHQKMQDRVMSLVPGERYSYRSQHKAWDTRISGALKELEIWASSPVLGRGFGAQQYELARGEGAAGIYHNAWTDTLAKTGLLGFVPVTLVVGGSFIIGRRMVRERVDRSSVLIGALGVIAASYYTIHGMSTGSFNSLRGGICLGLICGVLLRCREMQLTTRQIMLFAAEGSASGSPMTNVAETPDAVFQSRQTNWNTFM